MRRCSISWGLLAMIAVSLPGMAGSAPVHALFQEHPSATDLFNVKIFEEVLVPFGTPSTDETDTLAQALDTFVASGDLEQTGPLEAFLEANPQSPWRVSLLVDLGLIYRHVGRTTQALDAWEKAWAAGKNLTDPTGVALASRALGELLEANAGLGRQDRLESLIAEADGRLLSGLVTEKLAGAKESLSHMKDSIHTAFRCGPIGLAYLKATEDPMAFADPDIEAMLCTPQGTSLLLNQRWASAIGLKLQMARRAPGAPMPAMSLVHLSTGHFAALVYAANGKYLLQDPFLGDTWVSLATLDREASGFALIPAGPLPSGWTSVTEQEGATIWGKGAWGPGRPDDTRPDSHLTASSVAGTGPGMPRVAFHTNLVSLHLEVPVVDYTPLRGPRVDFKATYNQREYGQPQVFDYSNLGSKWTFSYLACLKDDTTNPNFNVALCNPGGGGLVFQSRGDGTFQPENFTQAKLTRLMNKTYVIEYLDGRKEFYDLADRAWGLRRLVLTRVQDKYGDQMKLTWDPMLRLVGITDAGGQNTSLRYELPRDPLKLTSVVDPFNRVTRFIFDTQGHLAQAIGGQGEAFDFSYGPTSTEPRLPMDFINSVTTSKGTCHFQGGEKEVGPSFRRWLAATGPGGLKEYLEGGAGYAYEIPPEQIPQVPEIDRTYKPLSLKYRESYYWNAPAFSDHLDYLKAHQIRWGRGPGGFSSGLVLSEKDAAGPRHWLVDTGDFWGGVYPAARCLASPLTPDGRLKVGKSLVGALGSVVDAGLLAPVFGGNRNLVTREYYENGQGPLIQLRQDFDPNGRMLRQVTPSGDAVRFSWDPATGDLKRIQNGISKRSDQFAYDGQHRLVSWIEPMANHRATYRTNGLLQTWQNGKQPAWHFQYDDQGRLRQAIRSGRVWTLSFDAFNRVNTVTDPSGQVHQIGIGATDPGPGQLAPASAKTELGLGTPFAVPEGAATAFENLFRGANGPLYRRLLLMAGQR